MEFQEVVDRRRMVRRYTDEPVDPAVVDRALRNATHAPSAGFSQGWGFLVLDRPDDVRRFWAASTGPDYGPPDTWLAGMMTAPVIVLPCSSRAAYVERYSQPDKPGPAPEERWSMPYWHLDTAMAALLILQTAVDGGLDACFFALPPRREDHVRRAFGVPADHDPIGVVAMGHRASDPETGSGGSSRRRARRPLEDVLHRGRWTI
ncbi:MAG: nitroreductase family protein [Nocardioides sp.]|nr:nitroreductase family protein [Nocardioides sp.]